MATPSITPSADFGPVQLPGHLGLALWQFERGRACKLIPDPDLPGGRWSATVAGTLAGKVAEIIAAVGSEHPIGASRCADRLAQRLGLDVWAADIEALAEAGSLDVVDVFRKKGRSYDLFAPAAVDALTVEQVTAVITARREWHAVSLSFEEACERLGWRRDELDQVVQERELERGRFDRFLSADIDALAGDTELGAQVLADRLLTADGATARMDVARRHFDIAVEAGWIAPARFHEKQVGRYKTVDVPLYRTRDVDALLKRPGVNWAEVRDTGKGERSPLLNLVGGRAVTRAQVIRAFLRDFGAQHKIEMWGWFVNGPDVWEIDWERLDGGPTKADVAAAIDDNPVLRQYRREIQLHSAAGAATRFARAMLEPNTAVILDTETTDLFGAVIEVAVIDAFPVSCACRCTSQGAGKRGVEGLLGTGTSPGCGDSGTRPCRA